MSKAIVRISNPEDKIAAWLFGPILQKFLKENPDWNGKIEEMFGHTYISPSVEDPAEHLKQESDNGLLGDECSGYELLEWHGVRYVVYNSDLDYQLFDY